MIRTYSELITFDTLEERYEYLKLDGIVGKETFGFDRWLNQVFYKRDQGWKEVRSKVITRDLGFDLGVKGYEIAGSIYVHHMNPVTKDTLLNDYAQLINPEFLICTSIRTHNAIHYGTKELIPKGPIVRYKNDTCPWRK